MFVYESETVYKYGSKQVVLKVDNGNQVSVKVGGGFIPVKDFIDRYNKIELDKLQRKDELPHYLREGNHNKMTPLASHRSNSTVSRSNNLNKRGRSRNKSELP